MGKPLRFQSVKPPASDDDVLVAELLQRLRGERGAGAAGAVDDDGAGAVRRRLLDPRLEIAAGHVHRARDMALAPLVRLAHVDEERRLRRGEQLARLGRVDLLDLALHLLEQFAVARHDFQEYSGAEAIQGGRGPAPLPSVCDRGRRGGQDDREDASRRDRRGRRGGRRRRHDRGHAAPDAGRDHLRPGRRDEAPRGRAAALARLRRPQRRAGPRARGSAGALHAAGAARRRARCSRATTRSTPRSAPRSRAGRRARSTT